MDSTNIAAEGLPVAADIRAQLLEPFITATTAAVAEMAGVDVAVQAIYRRSHAVQLDINAIVELESTMAGPLVLCFPEQTAAALANRVLAGTTVDLDENLLRDCAGEISNVVAGQAKALLAGTVHQFVFALPQVLVGPQALRPDVNLECLVVAFNSALGPFELQLFVARLDLPRLPANP